MKGQALQKYHAMEHEYPSRIGFIKKYGYDGKQLHHLVCIEDFLTKYIAGKSYKECLTPTNKDYLISIKLQKIPHDQARIIADKTIAHVTEIANAFIESHEAIRDPYTEQLIDDVQYQIMKIATKQEIM